MSELSSAQPKYTPDQLHTYTRRSILAGLLVGAAATVGIYAGLDSDPAKTPPKPELGFDPDKLDQQINDGILSKWKQVEVYSGFMTVSPDTPFYNDPTLRTRLASPVRPEQRLGVLRPFFVKSSLAYNGDKVSAPLHAIEASGLISPSTLAFLQPDNSDPRPYYFRFDPATVNAFKRIYLGDDEPQTLDLFGEPISQAKHYRSGNQSIPYLEIDDYDDYNYELTHKSFRLCGLAAAYDSSEAVNSAAGAFMAENTYEPITISALHDVTIKPHFHSKNS